MIEISAHKIENVGEIVRRQARRARFGKWTLALMALALVVMIVGFLIYRQWQKDKAYVPLTAAQTDAEEPVMMEPRFEGMDKNQQRYVIVAERAVQEKLNQVDLVKPEATIALNSGANWTLTADRAKWYMTDHLLQLNENVRLQSDTGYEITTEAATVDAGQMHATGEFPVSGTGPQGTIRGDGFEVTDGGKSLMLRGNVKLVIEPATEE